MNEAGIKALETALEKTVEEHARHCRYRDEADRMAAYRNKQVAEAEVRVADLTAALASARETVAAQELKAKIQQTEERISAFTRAGLTAAPIGSPPGKDEPLPETPPGYGRPLRGTLDGQIITDGSHLIAAIRRPAGVSAVRAACLQNRALNVLREAQRPENEDDSA